MKPIQRLSLSLLLLSVPVFAQGPDAQRTPPPRPVILAIDTDHDGKFSVQEIAAASVGLISLDADHDGQLTSLEYFPSQSDPAANKPDETVQRLMSLDKDGDGELSATELRPRQQTPADRAKHILDEWDTNKDGKLTKPEAPDRIQQQFDAIDTNHDRVLSEDELVSYFTNMPQQPRRPEGAGNAAPNSQGPRP